MKLFGIIHLEKLVPFEKDLLGKEFKITLADREGILAMPSLPFPEDHEPFDFNSTKLLKPNITPEEFSDLNWGDIINWPIGKGSFMMFFIQFDISYKELASSIANQLLSWRISFLQQLSLVLERDYRSINEIMNIRPNGEIDLYLDDDDLTHIMPVVGSNIEVALDFKAPRLKIAKMIKILENLKNNQPILLFEQFLLNASLASNKKEYRIALLDIATSIKIYFSNWITKLTIIGKETVLGKDSSLGKKRIFLEKYSLLPSSISEKCKIHIEWKRNAVIHAGDSVIQSEARQAFLLAWEIIKLADVK